MPSSLLLAPSQELGGLTAYAGVSQADQLPNRRAWEFLEQLVARWYAYPRGRFRQDIMDSTEFQWELWAKARHWYRTEVADKHVVCVEAAWSFEHDSPVFVISMVDLQGKLEALMVNFKVKANTGAVQDRTERGDHASYK